MMYFRPINIEKDKELIILFRKDTYSIGSEGRENFDATSYIQRMKQRISKFPDGQLIIEDSNNPIGQVGFDIQENNGERIGYVNLFYLIPEYRGKGLGKELIRHVEDFFSKSNVSQYHLRVSSKNERAINLYTKMGMRIIDEEKDKLIMQKTL